MMEALPRTLDGLVRLARSGPWDSVRPAVIVAVYRLWLIAFALKMLGSTWDMSWHFKWLRDTAAPPHIINTIGTVIVVALVIYQARFNVGVDAWAKRLMVLGTGMFLIAIPIDVLNHEINGLDITAWSSSHILLYLGTAFMLLGCFRGFWRSTEPSRTRTIIGAVLWGFFLENMLFPSQHQEYGQLAWEAWLAGTPTAEPMLLEFAANQLGRPVDDVAVQGFALPVDSWVYPMWIVAAAVLTLVAARRFVGARWTATAIAGGYVGYRMVAWILLTGTGFPPSIPPFMLLAGAIMVDLAFLAIAHPYARALGGAMLATGATAAAAWVQGYSIGTPPLDYVAFVWGGIMLAIAWTGLSVGQLTPALAAAPAQTTVTAQAPAPSPTATPAPEAAG